MLTSMIGAEAATMPVTAVLVRHTDVIRLEIVLDFNTNEEAAWTRRGVLAAAEIKLINEVVSLIATVQIAT